MGVSPLCPIEFQFTFRAMIRNDWIRAISLVGMTWNQDHRATVALFTIGIPVPIDVGVTFGVLWAHRILLAE